MNNRTARLLRRWAHYVRGPKRWAYRKWNATPAAEKPELRRWASYCVTTEPIVANYSPTLEQMAAQWRPQPPARKTKRSFGQRRPTGWQPRPVRGPEHGNRRHTAIPQGVELSRFSDYCAPEIW